MKSVIKTFIPDSVLQKRKIRKLKRIREAKEVQFAGDKVFCPICESTYSEFDTVGKLVQRENAQCHNCRSLERQRLIYLFLRDELKFFEKRERPIKLLHFAPESYFFNLFMDYDYIDYTPCDLFPEKYFTVDISKIVKLDITDIPFEDDTFDFILCNHVLEHIPDDRKAMSELYRVMKTGGQGIFQVPIDYDREVTYEDPSITKPKDREKAFGQYDHVRWYGNDYPTRLSSVGFQVNENNFVSSFSAEDQYKFGLLSTEILYQCKK